MLYKEAGIRFKDADVNVAKREITGYAATWDKDRIDDVIHPGAFKRSLDTAFPARKIKTLWQHSLPFGMPHHMEEDSKGLLTVTKVSKTRENDERMEYITDGVVDSMSIGYELVEGKYDIDNDGIRHLRELKLFEYSPVTFACNEAAIIVDAKEFGHRLLKMAKDMPDDRINAMIDELKALLVKRDSLASTRLVQHSPQEVAAFADSLKQMKEFAQSIIN